MADIQADNISKVDRRLEIELTFGPALLVFAKPHYLERSNVAASRWRYYCGSGTAKCQCRAAHNEEHASKRV